MDGKQSMLTDDDVERIATRVAELVGQGSPPSAHRLVSARELASIIGVTCNWVYANSKVLGGRRLGAGPKGRLRFDPVLVRERLETIGGGAAPGTSEDPRVGDLPIYDLG